jgi:hypothetical protein
MTKNLAGGAELPDWLTPTERQYAGKKISSPAGGAQSNFSERG